MTEKARISLCMIVRNEEQNLADCLKPVAELFDEIVIVDTGSQDSTKEVARSFTPHVHDFPWTDDFSAARNESLRHATGDWIFWLDADDRVRPEHVERLRRLFAQLDDRPRVLMMDTILPAVDATQDERFVTHLRLFRRHPELRWEGRVHEQLQPEPQSLGLELVFTDIQIEHVGYLDRGLTARKHRRKLRLMRMDYAVDPDRPSTLLHLGMVLHQAGHIGEARRHLLRLVDMGLDSAFMQLVYDALASMALKEGNHREAIRFAQQGLLLFPDDEQLLFMLASAWYALENYSQATRTLERIIHGTHRRRMVFAAVANVRTRLAPCMLGAVHRAQRNYVQAEATLHSVLREFPADRHASYNLGLVYLDQNRGQDLSGIIRQLQTHPDGIRQAALLAALWKLRHGQPAQAETIINFLIARWPHLPRPRMLRAECLSRRGAPVEDQIRALRDVLRVQPSCAEAQRWLALAQRVQHAPVPPPAATVYGNSVVLTPTAAMA